MPVRYPAYMVERMQHRIAAAQVEEHGMVEHGVEELHIQVEREVAVERTIREVEALAW